MPINNYKLSKFATASSVVYLAGFVFKEAQGADCEEGSVYRQVDQGKHTSIGNGFFASISWFEKLTRKLSNIRMLGVNWDGQGAPAPLRGAIEAASLALEIVHEMEFPPRSVQATRDGGVAITFLSRSKYGDIEFFDQDSAAVLVEDLENGDEKIFEVSPTREDITEALGRIREHIVSA